VIEKCPSSDPSVIELEIYRVVSEATTSKKKQKSAKRGDIVKKDLEHIMT